MIGRLNIADAVLWIFFVLLQLLCLIWMHKVSQHSHSLLIEPQELCLGDITDH